MALLKLSNISKSFKEGEGKKIVLKSVSISFPHHGFYAIEGKSGSGKSSILNLIAGLLKPDKGKIIYKGRNIYSFNKKEFSLYRLNEIAFLFQNFNLIEEETCLNNIMLPSLIRGDGKKKSKEKAIDLANKFGLSSLLNSSVSKMSGGERQRICLARSLMNDAKIILCDEPTGALDEANSKTVMEYLKDLSKDRLIILVSHNQELTKSYCDEILSLEDGRIEYKKDDEAIKGEISYRRNKTNWTRIFLKRNLKKNAWINSLSIISGLIGFSSLLLSIGFYNGSKLSLEKEAKTSFDYYSSSISEKTYIDIEGSPLRLIKKKRPLLEDVREAVGEDIKICYDTSFFLPEYATFEIDGKQIDCKVSPYYFSPKEIGYGSIEEELELEGASFLINKEFKDKYKIDLGAHISIERDYSFLYKGKEENGSVLFEGAIGALLQEFSFLNEPKIYIPYQYIKEELEKIELRQVSLIEGKAIDAYSFISLCSDEHQVSNYSYLLFAKSKKEANHLFEIKQRLEKESNLLSLYSPSFSIVETYSSLTNAFSLSLLLFVGIAFIGIVSILGFICNDTYIRKKRENAILLCLGAKESSIFKIFFASNAVVLLISSLISLPLSFLLQIGANRLISFKFHLNNLIKIPYFSFFSIPLLLPLGLFLFSSLIAFFSTFIPFKAYGSLQIAEVLKEE